MAQANYREIRQLIRECKPFKGNSAWAIVKGDNYIVYSYSTVMLTYNMKTKAIDFNELKYSVTTSKLQNIIRNSLLSNIESFIDGNIETVNAVTMGVQNA